MERAIVFGHPTLSREVPALFGAAGSRPSSCAAAAPKCTTRAIASAAFVDALEVSGPPDADRSWLGRWVSASRALLDDGASSALALARTDDWETMAKFAKSQLEVFREPVTRRMLVDAVWRASWPHDRLVLGASRLISEADCVVPGRRFRCTPTGGSRHRRHHLDGIRHRAHQSGRTAAAAAGITRVLLGDLTLLHDVGALLFGGAEPRPRIQVIVGNDGGGTIFDGLEVASSASPRRWTACCSRRTRRRFESLAPAYGWDYLRAGNRGELDQALTASGSTLIEVPLPGPYCPTPLAPPQPCSYPVSRKICPSGTRRRAKRRSGTEFP